MYVVTVVFDAVSGRADALEDAQIAQAENSLREEAAFNAHLQTPHFLDFNEKTAEMIANMTADRWSMIRATG